MFGFFLKKSFCDGWDNLFSMVLVNLICLFGGMGMILLTKFIQNSDLLIYGLILLAFLFFSIVAFAYGEISGKIADFCGVGIKDFFIAVPKVLKDAIIFALICFAITIVSIIAFDYYFIQMQSTIGFLMGAMIGWIDILLLLSFQWVIPIRSLMHNPLKKCIKKSFIIFFDNTGFSILMGIYHIVMIAISIVFIGFFPSVAGIVMADTNALRLRLYKYDYLEEHPELTTKRQRRQIPWEELIYEDRETLGPRKFKSFFMPWKVEE